MINTIKKIDYNEIKKNLNSLAKTENKGDKQDIWLDLDHWRDLMDDEDLRILYQLDEDEIIKIHALEIRENGVNDYDEERTFSYRHMIPQEEDTKQEFVTFTLLDDKEHTE